ncbi:phage integrase N-terminal SAM-like domain-containing protein [Fodinibius roseus]|uniref:phage integrase N-terminal SAM-like domain-containing protein n=1 Tax=Fodinibius roseus TaxID=1194090 RepID=UPI0033141C5A
MILALAMYDVRYLESGPNSIMCLDRPVYPVSWHFHPCKLDDKDVKYFLTYLAKEKNVSAGTQNQALSTFAFLYLEVL